VHEKHLRATAVETYFSLGLLALASAERFCGAFIQVSNLSELQCNLYPVFLNHFNRLFSESERASFNLDEDPVSKRVALFDLGGLRRLLPMFLAQPVFEHDQTKQNLVVVFLAGLVFLKQFLYTRSFE